MWRKGLRRLSVGVLLFLVVLSGYAGWFCWQSSDPLMKFFAFAYAAFGLACLGATYKIVAPSPPAAKTSIPALPANPTGTEQANPAPPADAKEAT